MSAGDHSWHVLAPGSMPDRVEAVRRFRGRMLFDDGLRPQFCGPDGPYDGDALDPVSHHVVGSGSDDPDQLPEAALRVLPLDGDTANTSVPGICDRLLGDGATADLLDRLGLDPADVWEGSGWAVRRGPGRAVLSARVLAAGAAAARDLGRVTLLGASGTRYGQLHRVLSAGFRRAEETPPIPVPAFADELQIVHGTLEALRPEFRALVDEMTPRLVRPAPTPG